MCAGPADPVTFLIVTGASVKGDAPRRDASRVISTVAAQTGASERHRRRRGGQMGDEAYLEQLIDALQQLHDRATQVRPGQRDIDGLTDIRDEFNQRLLDALAIASSLNITRMAATHDIPDLRTRLRQSTEILEQELALKAAVLAINPDYSVEAIDNAIRVAEGQRDFVTGS